MLPLLLLRVESVSPLAIAQMRDRCVIKALSPCRMQVNTTAGLNTERPRVVSCGRTWAPLSSVRGPLAWANQPID